MDSRVTELEVAVESLREEVRELRLALQRLKRELETRKRSDSEFERGTSYSSVLDSPLRAPSSAGFSLVTGGGEGSYSVSPSVAGSRPGGSGVASRGGPSVSRSPQGSAGGSARPTLTWEEREEICDEIAESAFCTARARSSTPLESASIW